MPLSPRCRMLGIVGAIAGCAAPASGPRAPVPDAAGAATVSASSSVGAPPVPADPAQLQALRGAVADQARLDGLAFALLSRAVSLCPPGMVRGRIGWRALSAADYAPAWREAAAQALQVSDSLAVIAVAPGSPAALAGMRPGDRLVRVGKEVLPADATASARLQEVLAAALARPGTTLPVLFERGDTFFDKLLRPRPTCDYPVLVVEGDAAAAYSDGGSIYVTTSLLHLASDAELSVVLAHELAHLLLEHIRAPTGAAAPSTDAPETPALPRTAAARGPARRPGGAGRAFSPEQEIAADRLAVKALALAGGPLDAVPAFWRGAAASTPLRAFAAAHPSAPDRLDRLARAVAAVRQEQGAGEAAPAADAQPPSRAVATAAPAAPAPGALLGNPVARTTPAPPREPPARSRAAPPRRALPGKPVTVPASPAAPRETAGSEPPEGGPESALRAAAPALAGAANAEPATVRAADDAWLYASPDIESRPLGRILKGAVVVVRSRRGDWLEVEVGVRRGWLLAQEVLARREGR